MKLVISTEEYKLVRALQQVFDVTIMSDKGLVFMYRDDWQRICGFISEHDDCVYSLHHRHNPLMESFNMWSECFLVVYDRSEDYSAHAICNFELFQVLCRAASIRCVLLPMFDLVSYARDCDAHDNNEAFGCYVASRGDILIDVEDN